MNIDKIKIKKLLNNGDKKVIQLLVDHLEYSLKDINSYDELTSLEKNIIPKEVLDDIQGISLIPEMEESLKPWVGEKYYYGVNGYDRDGKIILGSTENPGKKILVIVPFHTHLKSEKIFNLKNKINNFLDSKVEWKSIGNLYRSVTRHLAGPGSPVITYDLLYKIWNQISYIAIPTSLNNGIAVEFFYHFIEELDPDLIVVYGRGLYSNLPISTRLESELRIQTIYGDVEYVEILEYDLEGKEIPLIGVNSNTSLADDSQWSKVVSEFITKY